jgi:hypothetical protein
MTATPSAALRHLGDRILLAADFSEVWTGGSSLHSVLRATRR